MSAVSALTPARMSIRQFARRDGCDEKRVRNAIRTGHLRLGDDGKLDAALVGTGWREMNRRAADTADKVVRTLKSVRTNLPNVRTEDRRLPNYPAGMAAMAHCAAYHLAAELHGKLPHSVIVDIVEDVAIAVQNEAALILNEESMPLSPEYHSWLEHPLFNVPALTEQDWADIASDAEQAKAGTPTTDA